MDEAAGRAPGQPDDRVRSILQRADAGLGLATGTVRTVAHHPGWATAFRAVESLLREQLSGLDATVAHIGSTAVPGLDAKPVLDIAIGAEPPIDVDGWTARIEPTGFEFEADLGVFGGLFFTVGDDHHSFAHLHVVDRTDFQWRWYLMFRDALRSTPALRDEYAARKRIAAEGNPGDRAAYTAAKFDWVLATVRRLEADAGGAEP